ncbi:MAG: hypothetical protein R3Y54_10270 [Eubacteriales bacterium]
MDKILGILKELQLPFAYDHFVEGESKEPPFLCYLLPKTNHFSADGVAYQKINEMRVELYTDKKDIKLEDRIESALEREGIFYQKSETWIASEKLYEVLYLFDQLKEEVEDESEKE